MASTYTRPRSPFVWLRYQDESGKWKGRATGYRADNIGDRRQAELLARRVSQEELTRRPVSRGEYFQSWVEQWLADRFSTRPATFVAYSRSWRRLSEWLRLHQIQSPRQFYYRHTSEYREWRRAEFDTSQNTIIVELKFMGQVLQEAVRRGYAEVNPCVRLGLKRDQPAPKSVWTDEEIATVADAIQARAHWMRTTFILGLYQAARLNQIPRIGDIDFARQRITYAKTKGDKPFTHEIDPRAVPHFRKLVSERLAQAPGAVLLCEMPGPHTNPKTPPSVQWRDFLDALSYRHLCHHGLRNTWITRACQADIHISKAKRFVNHGSTSVHEIYQRLSVADVMGLSEKVSLPSF